MADFDFNGVPMVPLRCGKCSEQIGLTSEPVDKKPDIVPRCYSCAAVEEAEAITAAAISDGGMEG